MKPYTGKNAKLAKISSEIVTSRRQLFKSWRNADGKRIKRAMRQESRRECVAQAAERELVYVLTMGCDDIGTFDTYRQAFYAWWRNSNNQFEFTIHTVCLDTGRVFRSETMAYFEYSAY